MFAIDLAIIVLYLTAVVGVGVWFTSRSGSTEEFMAAGRSLPGWVVGLSIFGTYVSSISFIANPGKSYQDNWNPFVFSLSIPLAAVIAVYAFVPFYRRLGEISAYHHLEQRFGAWARVYAVACYLLTQLGRVGTIMYLVALVLAPLLKVPVLSIILVTGALVTLYTLLGGIEAVIWTDAIQSLVLTLGIVMTCIALIWSMPEGPMQIVELAQAQQKFSLGSLKGSLTETTFWITLVYGLFINLQNFGIDQSYVQRYATARSDADATRSVWVGALLYVPISAALFFVGTGLFAYYQVFPNLLPAGTGADNVYPWFIVHQLPVGITGLLIAAIMAAAMSSVDSSLNCSATLILCDVYKRFWRPQASERESMRVLYGATLLFGVLGTAVACAMIGSRSVLDLWWQMAGIFSGGMLGLFLLGYLSPRAQGRAALGGVAAGLLIIVWMTLGRPEFWAQVLAIPAFAGWQAPLESFWRDWSGTLVFLQCPFHSMLTIVFSTSAIVLVGYVLARLFPTAPPARVN